jgi:hypothetical protein
MLLTSFFIHRLSELRVIYACSIVTSTLAVLLFAPSNVFRLIIFYAIGIPFSIGQLTSLVYFWKLTVPEERGRVAGLIGFVSLLFYLSMYATVTESLDFNRTVVLSIIFSLAPLVTMLFRPKKAVLTTKKGESANYSEKRTLLLYSIPWILFSVINSTIAKSISFHISQQVPPSSYLFLTVLQFISALFGALFGGAIADFFGRRVSLALSLTLYGVSSALAGMTSSFAVLYFVYIANGSSWGILLAMYSFVIWGDLSNKGNCAKMYAIGFVTFYLTQSIGLLPLEQIFQIPLVASSLASCVLIFLSIIPVFLAPELLSSDFKERVKLKMHISTVKKIRQSRNQG